MARRIRMSGVVTGWQAGRVLLWLVGLGLAAAQPVVLAAPRAADESAGRPEQFLPEDATQRFSVKEVQISGNSLITSAELLQDVPAIYNVSDKPLKLAAPDELYDFRTLKDIISQPGPVREVSARTIEGFTRFILGKYQQRDYAGIYVYVPKEAIIEQKRLENEVLPVRVLEAKVTEVTAKFYDTKQNSTEEGFLKASTVQEWSPVKPGEVASQKELDDFVNLLNLNPDRYVSAVVTRAAEPDSLAVAYDIYEANPWHWFVQVDNSGTKERQWDPRVGLINTNLFGIDDIFTALYQAPWDATVGENYALYGSYDIPVLGPRLRLTAYGGYTEYDTTSAGGYDFLGRGSFYGGILRYNVLQAGGWFFDIKGSVEHTRSKVTPSLFPEFLGTDIKFWLWGCGVQLHRRDDTSTTAVGFDRYESWGGESSGDEFRLARRDTESDFAIYAGSASHSRYLDGRKVQRVGGVLRWIGSDERLVPAKMTGFGGMYSIRGYDEYEVVADGGVLASAQYEFDIVKYEQSLQPEQEKQAKASSEGLFLKKLAPLVFFDYGRAKIRHPVGAEKGHEELMSVGGGALVELGENLSGAVYYGYPLTHTDDTRTGKGRVNAGLMIRW
jgi:hemolysin activation/secretion protein